ncbi:MAG: VgrG-related protein [Anaerolineales bacterium]|nr:VgrG-related protein [Anaerolineales bacterium]
MDNPLQAAQQAAASAASAAQNAASAAQGAAQNAMTPAQQAAGTAQQAAQNAAATAQQAVQNATATAQQAAQNAMTAAQQAAQNATAAAQQAAQNATAAAQQAVASAQEAAQNAVASAQEAAQNATAAAQEAVASAQEAAQNAVASAQEAAQNAAAAAQEAAQQAANAAQEAVASAQEAAQNAAAAAQETVQQAAEAAQQAAEAAANAAQEAAAAAQEAAQQAAQAAQEAVAAASEMAQNAITAAQEAAQAAVAAAQQAAAAAAAAVQEAAAATQEALQGVAEAAQEAAAAATEAAQGAAGAVSDLAASAVGLVPAIPTPLTKKDVLISQFFLKIGGKKIPQPEMEELMRDVIEIVVDDNLHLPDMFMIHLHDKSLKWVDSPLLAVGEEVEIAAKAPTEQGAGAEQEQGLIKGEITALEPDFTILGEPTLRVRGYDRAHRLHRGRKSRSYLKAKDSEIARKIAQEVGLQAQVDPTTTVYEYIFQNNQTNWEFLLERANRIGYQLYVEDKTLHFRKGNSNQGQGPELEWGVNLRTFRPRLTVVHQADEVIVRGWDPKTKQAIVGRASGGELMPAVGVGKSGGQLAKEIFRDSAQAVVVDEFISTQGEAQLLAQALWDEISGDFIQADGVCMGDPRLQAGRTVQISAVGDRFSGTYFVTSAIHTYNVETGYETTFNVSGRKPNMLSFLLSQQNGNGYGHGLTIGLVTNNRDPEGMGRVKLKFPWLSEQEESTWARISSPMAGDGRGFFYLPEINDEVLVAFEHGDIHRPYVLGVLWGKDKPPLSAEEAVSGDKKVNKRILKSRSGHRIILDDTAGQEKIEIIDKSGNNSVVINTATNNITIQAGGSQKVTLDGQGQSIQMQGGGRMVTLRGGQVQIT